MSKVKRLTQNYGKYIAIPWRDDAAAAQRVVFCVYNEGDERMLRARFDEFELATQQAGHEWISFDLTDTFATWMASQRYAKSYFADPNKLPSLLRRYSNYITDEFNVSLEKQGADANTVVALKGVGSLFGFLKVKEVVEKLAPLVKGRLLVFFPGSYEKNNYRLLDGYDGWNYLAVPITADREF